MQIYEFFCKNILKQEGVEKPCFRAIELQRWMLGAERNLNEKICYEYRVKKIVFGYQKK